MQPSSYPPPTGTMPPPPAPYPPPAGAMPPAPYPPAPYPPTMTPPARPTFPFPGLRLAGVVLVMAVLVGIVDSLLPASAVSARKLAYPQPVVSIAVDPTGTVQAGAPVTFTANVTAGRDLTYSWDFGDNSSGSGVSATHTYTSFQQGGFSVSLTASDPLGQSGTAQATVNVLPPPPQAAFTATQDPNAPNCYTFDGSGSSGYQLSYNWQFGDGNSDTSGNTSPYYCYYFDAAGNYTVTLTVTDSLSSLDSNLQDRSSTTSHSVYNPGF